LKNKFNINAGALLIGYRDNFINNASFLDIRKEII